MFGVTTRMRAEVMPMSRTVIAAFLCLLGPVCPTAAHPASAAELHDYPRITIRVYNYAGVAADQLRRAQEVTEHIFGKAGIDVTWIACPLAEELRPNYPDCQKSPGN